MDVKLGADIDQVEWALGFKGSRVEKDNTDHLIGLEAQKSGLDFDYAIHYQHIMWMPVTDLLFKDGKVCMIRLSSYPEYNKMLCADIGTTEGLNFWDNAGKIGKLYGVHELTSMDDRSYIVVQDKGLGLELQEDEVRAMVIFQSQIEE